MDKQRAKEALILIKNRIIKEIPFNINVTIHDKSTDYYEKICMFINPHIKVDCFKFTTYVIYKDDDSLQLNYCVYVGVDEVLSCIIKIIKEKEPYSHQYKLAMKEKELVNLEEKMDEAIKKQGQILDLLHNILDDSTNATNCVGRDISFLNTLQDMCLRTLQAMVDYHPDSEKVIELEKEFKKLAQ
jgi:hypothetical protein